MNFKGVILAGGRGSRLSPLTDITNKFLMPVYDKLMIEYSVRSLASAGVKEIAIILGTKSAGETMNYLKSGVKYGVKFTYFYQDEPKGVPHALYQAKEWAGNDPVVVLCADNIIYDNLRDHLDTYEICGAKGAYISTKRFEDKETLRRFAILRFEMNDVVELVEKPFDPPSQVAFCGIQIYDNNVWDIIEGLVPSPRNEFEIVDVLNTYITRKEFLYDHLKHKWFDCGNKDSLFEAQHYAYLKSIGLEENYED